MTFLLLFFILEFFWGESVRVGFVEGVGIVILFFEVSEEARCYFLFGRSFGFSSFG